MSRSYRHHARGSSKLSSKWWKRMVNRIFRRRSRIAVRCDRELLPIRQDEVATLWDSPKDGCLGYYGDMKYGCHHTYHRRGDTCADAYIRMMRK